MLSTAKFEAEIGRKAVKISLHLLIQLSHWNAVKLGQIRVKNDLLIPQHQDLRSNSFGKDNCSFVHD